LYNIIGFVFETIISIFTGVCLVSYFDSFMERKIVNKWHNQIIIILLYVILDSGLSELLPSTNESVTTVIKLIPMCLFVFVIARFLYEATWAFRIFLVGTFIAVKEISLFLAMMIMQIGSRSFSIWLWCMEKGYIQSLDAFTTIIEATANFLQICMYVLFVAVLYLSLCFIKRNFRDQDIRIQNSELMFIIAPSLTGFFTCVMLRAIMITMEGNELKILYEKHPLLLFLVPIILSMALLSILYSVKLFQDMISMNREKRNRIIFEQQLDNMQKQMREMERVYTGVRSVKHDMKNTLAVILQLLAKTEDDIKRRELQSYLAELSNNIEELELCFQTGNGVIDTLLTMKYHEIMEKIPELKMDAKRLIFPNNLLVPSYDIGVIIGNALDNAIEACERLKNRDFQAETFIRITSFQRGNMFFIEMENSFDGIILRKKECEFPMSRKTEIEAHGIGMSNIKNAAVKYHGAVDWSVENNVFTLCIMLKNGRRDEDESL